MSQKCPQCGSEFPPGEKCRDRFDLCLALEFENPTTYGNVHHLTVACYMLQHNEYSQDAWFEARKMIAQFVFEGISPTEIRKQKSSKMDSSQRTWNISKGKKLSEFDSIAWTCTIAEIRLDKPETYCKDVVFWAKSILADTNQIGSSYAK